MNNFCAYLIFLKNGFTSDALTSILLRIQLCSVLTPQVQGKRPRFEHIKKEKLGMNNYSLTLFRLLQGRTGNFRKSTFSRGFETKTKAWV